MNIKQYTPKIFLAFFCLCIAFTACKKSKTGDVVTGGGTGGGITATGTRAQLTLDSIFLYAKETYLWYDALPTYDVFNPRKYTTASTDLGNFQKELFDITQYKINPTTGFPYEYLASSPGSAKYSYIVETTTLGGKTSAVSLEGVGNDFGFALSSIGANDIRVRFVNPGSPAALAGMARGFRLVKINGTAVRADVQSDVNLINAAFSQGAMTLVLEKPDLTQINVSLTSGTYNSSAVYKKAVLDAGGKKVGYVNFGRFASLKTSQTDLDNAFTEFNSAGIANLIVDLRYNGGGYVETSQYFANLIVPSTLNGSTMYSETFNNLLTSGKAPILAKQILYDGNGKPSTINGRVATYADVDYSLKGNTYTFSKKGSVNTIKNVYFLVSGSTASAAELLMNILRPYMNVKIIGTKTYGKPVGFFPIKIDKYTVYMSQFSSKNSVNVGEYFDGIAADFSVADDVTHDFGDPAELCTAKALSLIKDGTASTAASTMSIHGEGQVSSVSVDVKNVDAGSAVPLMIETRLKLKQ